MLLVKMPGGLCCRVLLETGELLVNGLSLLLTVVETRTYIAISMVFLLWVRSGLCRLGCPLEKELVDGIPALLRIRVRDGGALNVPVLCPISSCQRRCCDRRR
jgi:hypothetical protein